jgi:integrase
MLVEDIDSAAIERWRAGLPSTLSPRTKNKLLIQLHGIFRRAQKVYGLPRNPMSDIDRHRRRSSGDIQVFSVEEVLALVRAAASEQDATIYESAAFTGLRRGELLALRWLARRRLRGSGAPRPGELLGWCTDDAEIWASALGADGT